MPVPTAVSDILDQLRRILKLGPDSTLDDISAALDALEQTPEAVTALSAVWSSEREPDAAKINRLLGVTPEMLSKWAA